MTGSGPVSWLGRQARRGLSDLPRNIQWLLDAGVKSPAGAVGETVQSVGQKAASTIADVNPFTDGADRGTDRVDAAMRRAHELEGIAHEEARKAKRQADIATKTQNDADQAVAAARDEGEREVERVVADAQRKADEYVAAIRTRAQELAAQKVAATETEAGKRVEQAQEQAEEARTRAEHAVEQARQQVTEARERAEEAAVAARQAADEARERAERLAGEAEGEADEARRRADEADARRKSAASEGRRLGADADTSPLDLENMTKDQLLALGAEMGLELKRSLRKADVVSAVRKHAKEHGRGSAAS